jgi:SRSO17 transposase
MLRADDTLRTDRAVIGAARLRPKREVETMSCPTVDLRTEPWASALADARARMRPLFSQARVAESAAVFLDAALSGGGRRTGWARALRAGDPGPWRQQALLGRDRWCADALRDIVRDYVVDHIGAGDAVLSLGEVVLLKQGHNSCGVARQVAGPRRRIVNCQVALMLAYASEAGAALIDRGLHLPPAWTSDSERMSKASVPDEWQGSSSRAQLAARLLERTLSTDVPSLFVTAPTEFASELRPITRAAGKGLLAAIDGATPVGSPLGRPHVDGTAAEIARRLPFSAWRRIPSSSGGAVEEWAACELAAADGGAIPLRFRCGLLVRRASPGGGLLFYRSEHPMGTTLETLVTVARRSRAVEAIVRLARAEHGLDHNESRSWQGWHRHVGIVMMALAIRAAVLRASTIKASPLVEVG